MKKKIAIVGGGISGLSAAWFLSRKFPQAQITLYEKSNRLGGYLKTDQTKGMLFEKGARTFRTANSPTLLKLIREVGLENDLLFSKTQKRYLWHQESLQPMGTLLAPHFWRLLLEPFIRKTNKEETIYEFFQRRLGKKVADLMADPFCLGTFAGDSRKLSMTACFPQIANRRSLLFTPSSSLFTLRNGMQSLIDALVKKLSIEIRLNSEIRSLDELSADRLFVALPAPALNQLIPSFPKIECASLSLVNLGFSKAFSFPHKGYGYLSAKGPLMGMVWDSNIFPEQKGIRLTAMIRPEEGDPQKIALEALRNHLKIDQTPNVIETSRMDQVIPQLTLGHLARMEAWKQAFPRICFLGNYLLGPSVENCVLHSHLACGI